MVLTAGGANGCPRVAGEGGVPAARAGPDGPLHPGPGRPLCWKLCLLLLCLCEETAGRPWPAVLLLWHGPTWESQPEGGAMNRKHVLNMYEFSDQ